MILSVKEIILMPDTLCTVVSNIDSLQEYCWPIVLCVFQFVSIAFHMFSM